MQEKKLREGISGKNVQFPKTSTTTFERTWKDAKTNPPKESGRYWCIVEEGNDLGKSHYQWNCSYNKGEGVWYGENWKRMKVIYWTELAPFPIEL